MSILHTWIDGNYISGCDKNINVGIVSVFFFSIGKDHCHMISVVEQWGLAHRIPSSVRV